MVPKRCWPSVAIIKTCLDKDRVKNLRLTEFGLLPCPVLSRILSSH